MAGRVNLTLPPPVDDLVAELATVTGQSKSAVIASYLAWQLPQLRAWLADYQSARPAGLPAAQVAPTARSRTAQESASEGLTRQERRALEREAQKDRKGSARGGNTHRHKGTSPKR